MGSIAENVSQRRVRYPKGAKLRKPWCGQACGVWGIPHGNSVWRGRRPVSHLQTVCRWWLCHVRVIIHLIPLALRSSTATGSLRWSADNAKGRTPAGRTGGLYGRIARKTGQTPWLVYRSPKRTLREYPIRCMIAIPRLRRVPGLYVVQN